MIASLETALVALARGKVVMVAHVVTLLLAKHLPIVNLAFVSKLIAGATYVPGTMENWTTVGGAGGHMTALVEAVQGTVVTAAADIRRR